MVAANKNRALEKHTQNTELGDLVVIVKHTSRLENKKEVGNGGSLAKRCIVSRAREKHRSFPPLFRGSNEVPGLQRLQWSVNTERSCCEQP